MTDLPFDALITFVPCRSLERSVAFYTDALGCRVVVEQPGCTILRCSSNGYIGVCERPEEVGATDGVVLTFVTEDVDAVAASIRGAGAVITVEPRYNATYGIYQCFADDPDGNVVEVQRFDDPAWGS